MFLKYKLDTTSNVGIGRKQQQSELCVVCRWGDLSAYKSAMTTIHSCRSQLVIDKWHVAWQRKLMGVRTEELNALLEIKTSSPYVSLNNDLHFQSGILLSEVSKYIFFSFYILKYNYNYRTRTPDNWSVVIAL